MSSVFQLKSWRKDEIGSVFLSRIFTAGGSSVAAVLASDWLIVSHSTVFNQTHASHVKLPLQVLWEKILFSCRRNVWTFFDFAYENCNEMM